MYIWWESSVVAVSLNPDIISRSPDMTHKQILIKEFGLKGYEKLSPSLKELAEKLDALPPVGRRGLLKKRKRAAA